MERAVKRKVCKHTDGSFEYTEDLLALEKKVRISVNGKEVVSLYCTPHMVKELAVGLMMTENIIRGNWCAERMAIEYGGEILVDIPAEGEVVTKGQTITSGCVGGVTFENETETCVIEDPFTIDRDSLRYLFSDFQARSELYKLTGCVHSAALSDGKVIICFAEDIGRHNAVDKVIGYALLEHILFSGKIMLASGRISSEISSKCSRWGIPILATRTAPTNRAVEIADKRGVTVVGFVRGSRFNVYTHPERIT
ncbi:MAG TPA: formate dehydrogenase accessory sulfurtransferase FdhD [Thermodesulfovibrionales bacterium]|nr:formate dehydrogenase accessory sulfurtransferase FdhD [Thermodesulfovibrionales bacterium]